MPLRRPARIALVAICTGIALFLVRTAAAEDVSRELAPGLDVFVKLNDRTRLYFMVAHTDQQDGPARETEVGVNVDFTLMPIVRPTLRAEDWTRDRYIWVRAGYRVLENETGRIERRPVAELHARAKPAETLWLFSRLRYEHRDVAGDESWRFRVRLGVEKEMTLGGQDVVPYFHAEAFYDSRFNAWSRERYEAGAEITLSKHWRIEPYVARQRDDQPSAARLDTLGVNLKYFH